LSFDLNAFASPEFAEFIRYIMRCTGCLDADNGGWHAVHNHVATDRLNALRLDGLLVARGAGKRNTGNQRAG
jgi:hypothetical protein